MYLHRAGRRRNHYVMLDQFSHIGRR
jgi:hypothetical protein